MRSAGASILGLLVVLLGLNLTIWAQEPKGESPNGNPGARDKKGANGPATDDALVERVVAARREYQLSLERLRAHYISVNDTKRAFWAEEELLSYHRILKQSYRIDIGDVPPPTLEPKFNIPDANKLYREALKFKDKGFGSDYVDNQRTSEQMLQQLLTLYPRCDKIGEAAYQLGEIYESKAFRQYERAAAYYERSFQWNKTSQSDARLRAARLYDKVLRNEPKALQLYREVIDHDTDDARVKEAERRLGELRR